MARKTEVKWSGADPATPALSPVVELEEFAAVKLGQAGQSIAHEAELYLSFYAALRGDD